ncbi:MAG: hypothetical protein H0U21_06200, partial [Acidimicrobiia bacterium]|nr:hypothetical protein [Acidimicrobiia bacterium]
MNAKRAAAAVLAIVLIVAALLVRRTIIDDDAEGPEDSALDPAEIGTLVCAAELADVCTAVAARHTELVVDVAPASVTMDGLAASGSADAPLWLTFEPWPGMVESLRANAGEDPLFDDTRLLAASRLAVATPTPQRAEALAATCAGTPLWR